MAIFDNLTRPNNPKRQARATDLANDCASLIAQLGIEGDTISGLVAADGEIEKIYNAAVKPGGDKPKPRDFNVDKDTVISVGEFGGGLLLSIYAGDQAAKYAEKALLARLVNAGRFGEAGFARVLGLPRWYRVGKWGAGAAGAVGATIIVDFIGSAIGDEAVYSKTREAIHALIKSRVECQKAVLGAVAIRENLAGLKVAMEIYKATNVKLTPEQLKAFGDAAVKKIVAETRAIGDESAKQRLIKFDQLRNSWTVEDEQ